MRNAITNSQRTLTDSGNSISDDKATTKRKEPPTFDTDHISFASESGVWRVDVDTTEFASVISTARFRKLCQSARGMLNADRFPGGEVCGESFLRLIEKNVASWVGAKGS